MLCRFQISITYWVRFMVYWLLMHILSLFLDLFASLGIANSDKDLEIILLRQVQPVRKLCSSTNAAGHADIQA